MKEFDIYKNDVFCKRIMALDLNDAVHTASLFAAFYGAGRYTVKTAYL